MKDLKEQIKCELKKFGIVVAYDESCIFEYDGKNYKSSLKKRALLVKNQIKDNDSLLIETIVDFSSFLDTAFKEESDFLFIDDKMKRLFTDKDSYNLFCLLEMETDQYKRLIVKEDVFRKIKNILNSDINRMQKDFVFNFPDYKIALDWILRRNHILEYMCKLIYLLIENKWDKNVPILKEASGIQGPWSRLDLPMKERVFEWSGVDEELRGRDRDIRNLRRDRKSFYWREVRNEPYAWNRRFQDSPYPQLRPGTWR